MGDFVSPLDGAVPPTAAGRDLRQSGGCLFGGSSWPSAAKARVGAALPGPDGDGEIWLCRLNQSRTGNGQELHFKKRRGGGFPGGAVVENLPANAGNTGSSPGLGGSHMPRSSWAREPQLLSLRVWSPCSATREAAIVRGPRTAMKSGPRLLQLEKALAQKRRPNTAKNK